MSWNTNSNANGWSRPTWRPSNNNQYNNDHHYNKRYQSNNNHYGRYGNRNNIYGHNGKMNGETNQHYSNNNNKKKRDYWGRDNRKQKSIKPDPASTFNNAVSTSAITNRNNNSISNNNNNRNNSNNDDEILEWMNAKTHDQKIRLLLPRIQGRGPPGNWVPDMTYYNNIPIKILKNTFNKAEVKKKSDDAVKAAIAAVEKFYKDAAEENTFQASKKARREEFDSDQYFSSDDDSFDDDPMYGGGASHKKQNSSSTNSYRWNGASLDEVKTFVRNLPMHLLFTASFEATGSRAEEKKLCHCPCSTRYSSQWQRLVASNSYQVLQNCRQEEGCNNLFDSCNGKLFQDFALVAHLRQLQKNDPFHHGILEYVETYYSKYIGKLSHGAITKNVNDKLFQKFEQYRIHDYECQVEKLKQEKIDWRKKHDEVIQKMNREKTEEQQDKQREIARIVENNRKLFDYLGLKEGQFTRNLSEKETAKYTIHYQKFIDTVKKANGVREFTMDVLEKSKSKRKDILLTEPIPQDFNLSELFQVWKKGTKVKNDLVIFPLFSDFDEQRNKDALKLLNRAEWNLAHYAKNGTLSDEVGVDHGGLTRVFLENAFDQMKNLYIKVPSQESSPVSSKKVKLFDKDTQMLQPVQDDVLEYFVRKAIDESDIEDTAKDHATDLALSEAKEYYRAFGRLMIHSLVNKNILPHSLMPGLYRAYLFCDKRPTDEDYVKAELFQHLREMNIMVEGVKDIKKQLEEFCIKAREEALKAILEGLTLDGRIDLRTFFITSSVQVVDKLLFSLPIVTAQDILDHTKFTVMDSSDNYYDELSNIQKKFKETTFPTFLRTKEREESEFLILFLKLVTGLPFINRGNPTIKIVFTNQICNGYEHALPESHTCEQEIDFPLGAYDANLKILDEKLSIAVFNANSQITMN